MGGLEMMIHGGALFGLGGGGSTELVCCDQCGVIGAESVAQTGGWGMWVETLVRHQVETLVHHHHCPAHIREDESQWYAP
jgi:hypothetical protein